MYRLNTSSIYLSLQQHLTDYIKSNLLPSYKMTCDKLCANNFVSHDN